ncbi:MAG: ribonuclease D [Pseudomonadota bacterium]|nr:ribonuclease D [Pseudomonadota bacterium]
MTIQFVNTEAGLNTLCQQLADSEWLAVDTEFHREKTYFPQLCLIQVASNDVIACVDPLAISDLSPLMALFYSENITIVFHAARQDLELFFLMKNALPPKVFDTQLAATVLGYGDQIGYGNLVKQCLGVELDKGQARTDWRQRPLSEAQVDYAADDVRYLRQLYLQLVDELNRTGRVKWLSDDFAALTAKETYQEDPQQSWLRVKGAGRLKSQQLVILQELGAWREKRAIEVDLPRRWILKDDVMLDLARFSPTTVDAMKKIRGLEPRDIDRYGKILINVITAAKEIPKEQWPVLKRPTALSNQQEALIDALMALLRKSCDEQSITPSAVATRKDIESLVRGQDCALLHGWRYKIIGQTLQAFMHGKISIQAQPTHLEIKES